MASKQIDKGNIKCINEITKALCLNLFAKYIFMSYSM